MAIHRELFNSIVLAVLVVGCTRGRPVVAVPRTDPRADFRPTRWLSYTAEIDRPIKSRVRDLACPAIDREQCDLCLRSETASEAAACVIDEAYASDPQAASWARELLQMGVLVGVETQSSINANHLGQVALHPTLAVREDAHHLRWLVESLRDIESTFDRLSKLAPRPMLFRTRPHGVRFYRTDHQSYPSAYAWRGVVGYNVNGPLHSTLKSVRSVLFHEIFHLNDEGHGTWSESALPETHDSILLECGEDDECLRPFAPDETRVPNGTFYPFDPRTADVREYAADVGLRYYVEHREVLAGGLAEEPFKCRAPTNATTWERIVDEFFGGLDLTPPCTSSDS